MRSMWGGQGFFIGLVDKDPWACRQRSMGCSTKIHGLVDKDPRTFDPWKRCMGFAGAIIGTQRTGLPSVWWPRLMMQQLRHWMGKWMNVWMYGRMDGVVDSRAVGGRGRKIWLGEERKSC
eukprot:89328-Chlamydomonas_euryale.AAC.1